MAVVVFLCFVGYVLKTNLIPRYSKFICTREAAIWKYLEVVSNNNYSDNAASELWSINYSFSVFTCCFRHLLTLCYKHLKIKINFKSMALKVFLWNSCYYGKTSYLGKLVCSGAMSKLIQEVNGENFMLIKLDVS